MGPDPPRCVFFISIFAKPRKGTIGDRRPTHLGILMAHMHPACLSSCIKAHRQPNSAWNDSLAKHIARRGCHILTHATINTDTGSGNLIVCMSGYAFEGSRPRSKVQDFTPKSGNLCPYPSVLFRFLFLLQPRRNSVCHEKKTVHAKKPSFGNFHLSASADSRFHAGDRHHTTHSSLAGMRICVCA